MQKNKLAIVIALALVLAPALHIQAQEGSSGTNGDIKMNGEIGPLPPIKDPRFEGGPDRMPPVRINKEKGGENGDVGSIRAGIKGKMMSDDDDDVNDDKGGLRMKEEGRLRMDIKKSTDDDNRPELTDEQKAEMKKKYEVRKAELKTKIETRKDEIKKKLEDKAKERVKNILANVFKMLSNQLDRLTKADERIGEKIDSLKEKGLDVSAASSQYVLAQTAIAKAKVDVEATSSLSTEQADAETSKETLRSLVKTAADSIRSAGAAYKEVIKLLPKEPAKAEVETSTSTSTSVAE